MVNTSATGGPLAPAATPAPLEGKALLKFLQNWMVGVIGLEGEKFRPSWQPEPPIIPNATEVWAALRINSRPADTFPEVQHNKDAGGYDKLRRNEILNILVSVYDLGSGGEADEYAALLRDGLAIAQNLEPLQRAAMGLHSVGALQTVPSLLKERWLYRVDLPVNVVRMITRKYGVQNLLSSEGEIKSTQFDLNFNA